MISHLPLLTLMNRLNQTESAVFKLWMIYFLRVSVFSSDTYGVKILNLDICILEFISLLGKRF